MFRLFDMDNDGQLTHGEFQSGLVAMGLDVSRRCKLKARQSLLLLHLFTYTPCEVMLAI